MPSYFKTHTHTRHRIEITSEDVIAYVRHVAAGSVPDHARVYVDCPNMDVPITEDMPLVVEWDTVETGGK